MPTYTDKFIDAKELLDVKIQLEQTISYINLALEEKVPEINQKLLKLHLIKSISNGIKAKSLIRNHYKRIKDMYEITKKAVTSMKEANGNVIRPRKYKKKSGNNYIKKTI